MEGACYVFKGVCYTHEEAGFVPNQPFMSREEAREGKVPCCPGFRLLRLFARALPANYFAGVAGAGAGSNSSSLFCGKLVKAYSEIWNARFCISAFTGAAASETATFTNTGPAGIVSNSGDNGFAGSSFAPSAAVLSSFFKRSVAVPSAAGPDLVSATGGFSFFSSGLRPSESATVFPSKAVSLIVRAFAFDGAQLAPPRSVVSEKRRFPSVASRQI